MYDDIGSKLPGSQARAESLARKSFQRVAARDTKNSDIPDLLPSLVGLAENAGIPVFFFLGLLSKSSNAIPQTSHGLGRSQ